MEADAIEAAARLLADTRRANRVLSALPERLVPGSLDQAYAIQDRFRALWEAALAGWKAGATAVPVQKRFGLSEPIVGPFFASDTYQSPAELPAARFPHLCLESEFAFRFGRPLPPRPGGYGRREIVYSVEALIPAFEIIGPRFDSLLFDRATTAVADCVLNSAFVLGEPAIDWHGHDLARHGVILWVDGEVRAEGNGALVLGHPLNALEWTVNHLSSRGIGLEAGQIVSTGTTTGLVYVRPGSTAIADFGPLGTVEVTFHGAPHPQSVWC